MIDQVRYFVRFRFLLMACCGLIAWTHNGSAASLQISLQDGEGNPVENAVVEVLGPATPATPQSAKAVMDQIDKQFVPRVLAIPAGTSVDFPNKDNIHHHVYSFSPAKQFELPLYEGNQANPVMFEKPGIVILGCNIHDWMRGYVYVAESAHFGISGADGKLQLNELAAGEQTVRVWHSRLKNPKKAQQHTVVLDDAAPARLDLSLELKRQLRNRHNGSYR